ncbi:hypothetical protein [Leptolyngbya ohadii]|uniref:hypothetical protein n=1 Tax=Leptolyngbya ohadii TaxID=1962290 RepID=UPI0015C638EF|nr:hypothetical protein [Leptolyngbya ohadii]
MLCFAKISFDRRRDCRELRSSMPLFGGIVSGVGSGWVGAGEQGAGENRSLLRSIALLLWRKRE